MVGKKKTKKKEKIERKKIIQSNIEKENILLKNIFIFLGIFLLVIALSFFIIKASTHFKYKGVEFDIVKEGKLTLYHTSFPVIHNGENAEYNIYLRNDPRELEKKVPAKGTLLSIDDTVVNITQEFECGGKEVIAIANLVNMYGAIGRDFIRDENASCDNLGRYMYITIQPGNETSIENFGPNCYNINIKDCEILEGTERFIVGMLVKINFDLSK